MEPESGYELISVIVALATFGVTAFIIADGKGKNPATWAFFAVALAIIAFPVLLITTNEREPKVPYVAKAIAAFAIGLCIQLMIVIAQIS